MKKLWLMCMLISSTINAQTFDFSCDPLMDFIADFRDDTGYKGMIDAQLLTRAQINASGARINDPSSGIPHGVAAYAFPCGNVFVYVRERWDDNSDLNFKKKIVYHELGHAVFGFRHPTRSITCPDDAPAGRSCVAVLEGFGGHLDIMGYNSMVAGDDNWTSALERFNNTTRICGSNRGTTIIDN